MSTTVEYPTDSPPAPRPSPAGRPLSKRIMHQVRRLHLFLGLFLFPWAILYGVTAFLFNHPTAFPDTPLVTFDRSAIIGTPLETLPSPSEQAATVIAALNEKQKPVTPYTLGTGDAKYAVRDFIFATAKADERTFSIVYDVKGHTGTIRETTPPTVAAATVKAPFAVGKQAAPRQRGMGMTAGGTHNHADSLKHDSSITERFKAAAPTILERHGFPTGEITVTSAPELSFPVVVADTTWSATYSPLNGTVSGTPEGGPKESELSVRRFLLRMHLAHGYPGEFNAKWFWAISVDSMAFVMCFWGLSGLFMWWQIKATRKLGVAVLALSAVAATVLGTAMYGFLS